ncbi:PP2C family protein-serine/threonine phosphatase [Streptomyces sp. NPDC047079]|uniref:PP2C family protein-serine/threonine phosphatase n=1 Tax=Streptomyces sp. NPDC047079 TaxID=3154607 RepID=UPI0033C2113A
MIALAVLIIELTPAHFLYTGPFLAAVPALAAVTLGPRRTALAVALALAVSITTATYNQAWGTLLVYTNFLALALVSVAGFITSSVTGRSELDEVRRIAVAAQEVILRPVPERLGPVRAASLCLAAGTGAQVGGDLYEAVQTPYGVRMIVGDVRGKGLSGMHAVAVALGAFRVVAHYEDDLVGVMNHCAAALRREAAVPGAFPEEALTERFTTALIAQVPNDDPVVHLVNRGHPPPLVLHKGRTQALMPTLPHPPLGLEDLIPSPPEKPETYPFVPGDRLLLYTDGVIEARNPGNGFFPLPEAMESINSGTTPQEFLAQLHQALTGHTRRPLGGRRGDDPRRPARRRNRYAGHLRTAF